LTTHAFANAFKKLGGKIYTNTTVKGIPTNNGSVSGVNTNNGYISTKIVVNAGGGYTQEIAKMVGTELPFFSERHNILVTEPVEPILNTMLMSFSLNFYCQQTPHGSFIMGRTCDNQPLDLRVSSDSSFLENMSKTITAVMPRLNNLRILRQWAGLYNMSPDRHPVYDEAPEVKGFYSAGGFSGHGFMLAPATGQCMTELILGLPPTLSWQKLNISRFNNPTELLIEPSVV